jgi:hypothetical protein
MISKRSILKGAIGAGAAASMARADVASNRLPLPTLRPRHDRAESMLEGCSTLLDPVKQAAIDLAQQNLDRERAANERKRRSLSRLRSVSPAWIEAQLEKIDRHDNMLWEAFRKLAYGD